MSERRISLLPHQEEFLFSKAQITALIGGIGSGKTWSGAHYVLKKIQENPETTGFIGANSYSQLRDATLATLFGEFDKLNIKYTYNEKTSYVTVHSFKNALIKVCSLENYDVIRGMEIGWGWLDETRDTREAALDVVLGRLRCSKSKKLEIRITTSPSGFNWLYDRLLGEKATKDTKVIHAPTYANIHLPKTYLDLLESQYDERTRQQELGGEFVNLTSGKVYHAFNRLNHVGDTYEKLFWQSRAKLGVDFNIDDMNSCIGAFFNSERGVVYYVNSEISGLFNTYALADEIYKVCKTKDLDIVPDSTGKARKTSSKKSDHAILKDKGFTIVPSTNPFIEDRWNAVNKMLEQNRILIHPRCKKLIKELEQADLERATKDEGKHFHLSVAFGYVIHKYFSVVKKQYATLSARSY